MPIYEYICNDCQFIFEQMKSMKDTDSAMCPRCESGNTTKQLSASKTITENLKSLCRGRSPFR